MAVQGGANWGPGQKFGDDGPFVSYRIADPSNPSHRAAFEKAGIPLGGDPGDKGGENDPTTKKGKKGG